MSLKQLHCIFLHATVFEAKPIMQDW